MRGPAEGIRVQVFLHGMLIAHKSADQKVFDQRFWMTLAVMNSRICSPNLECI